MPDAPPAVNGDWLDRLPAIAIGVGLVAVAFAAYWLPGSDRFYNHFVWQALAFLDGRAWIDWPVAAGPTTGFGNDWMHDVYPLRELTGEPYGALLPFPPLPAIVLMPIVAVWGIATDERLVSVTLGAVDVGLAWWALGGLAVSRRIRLAASLFFGLGTVFWYAAQLGTTWFFAHVVAVTCLVLAVGIALRHDPAADDPPPPRALAGVPRGILADLRAPWRLVDARQLLAGFLFGLACTARLPIAFGAPFFVFVGSGGTVTRRAVSAGLGALLPVALLVAYNVATTGQLVHPGYEYLYQLEATGYPSLHYHPDWAIEDLRYVPQNLAIMLFSLPSLFPVHPPTLGGAATALCVEPGLARGLFELRCPIALPSDVGMSILLTSPGYLLVVPALLRRWTRLVSGAVLAIVAIAFVNLMHFSQGWVQFGYRFSNDFAIFALLLVAVGMARRDRVGLLGAGLIGLSIAVNAWGVIWGNLQGW